MELECPLETGHEVALEDYLGACEEAEAYQSPKTQKEQFPESPLQKYREEEEFCQRWQITQQCYFSSLGAIDQLWSFSWGEWEPMHDWRVVHDFGEDGFQKLGVKGVEGERERDPGGLARLEAKLGQMKYGLQVLE